MRYAIAGYGEIHLNQMLHTNCNSQCSLYALQNIRERGDGSVPLRWLQTGICTMRPALSLSDCNPAQDTPLISESCAIYRVNLPYPTKSSIQQ